MKPNDIRLTRTRSRLPHPILLVCLFFAGLPGLASLSAGTCTEGVCDLTRVGLEPGQTIDLNGQWEFRWDSQVTPDQAGASLPGKGPYFTIPGFWNQKEPSGQVYPGQGFATFRLKIINALPDRIYGFYLQELNTAYEIRVNGVLLGGVGTFGTTREKAWGNTANRLFMAPSDSSGMLDVVIHLSNFDFARGGVGISPVFAPADTLIGKIYLQDGINWAIMGIMLVVTLIFVLFGFLRHGDRLTLYFGLFSLALTLRMLLQGSRLFHTLLTQVPLTWLFSAEIFSGVLLVAFFLGYLRQALDIPQNSVIPRVISVINVAYGLICLSGVVEIIEPLIIWYDLVIILSGIWATIILVHRTIKGNRSAGIILLSFVLLMAATINDILFYAQILKTGNYVHLGFIAFLIPQTVAISAGIARSFNRETSAKVTLSTQLDEANRTQEILESMVDLRTRELMVAKNHAEAANKAKSLFLANMSHEMRTPLNVILGNSELISETDNPEIIHERSRIIMNHSEHLSRMIDSILDISKIEAGKLVVSRVPFGLAEMLGKLDAGLGDKARRQGLTFTMNLDPALPSQVCGDPVRLEQILMNLIQNAIKFTPRGQVAIDCRLKSQSHEIVDVLFTIKDTGIGMTEEDQRAVFNPFSQGEEGTKKEYAGTGLGTAISRELVQAMGGNIWFESTYGQGTEFNVMLPLGKVQDVQGNADTARPAIIDHESREADKNSVTLPSPLTAKGACILVVEDFEPNREITLAHLASSGYQALTASHGQEALEILEKEHVDLVLLDVHMPVMDGYETIRKIRDHEKLKVLKVIGLTADALVETRTRCIAAGMDEVLTKPVRKKALLDCLDRTLGKVPGLAVPSRQESPAGTPGEPEGPDAVLEIWDRKTWMDSMGNDEEVARMIVEGFLDRAPELLGQMKLDMEAGDLQGLHRNAHALKGGALNISSPALAASALALEKACKAGETQNLHRLFDALVEAWKQFSSLAEIEKRD